MNEKYIIFDIETTGLSPWYGNLITCICAKDSDGYIFCESLKDKTELELMEDFRKWVLVRYDNKLITVNGKEFDVPFLLTRLCLNNENITSTNVFLKIEHFDLCNDITDRRISLNNLAKLFNVKLKDGKGKFAPSLYFQKKFDELEKYCMIDVQITEEVYLKYMEMKNE